MIPLDVGHPEPSPRGRHHQGVVGDPREGELDVEVEVEVEVQKEERHFLTGTLVAG